MAKRPSLWHQWRTIIDYKTHYGFSRHKWKQRHKKGNLSPASPCIPSRSTRKMYLDGGRRITRFLKENGVRYITSPEQILSNTKTVDENYDPVYFTVADAEKILLGTNKGLSLDELKQKVDGATVADIKGYFDYYKDKRSPYTLHADRSAVSMVLGFDPKNFPLPPRKKENITRSRKETYASRQESQKIPGLVLFLHAVGLRRSELVNLHRDDIDLENGTVFVRRGKGGKSRTVPIREDLLDAIRLFPLAEEYPFREVKYYKNINIHGYRRKYAQELFQQRIGMGYQEAVGKIKSLSHYDPEQAERLSSQVKQMCSEIAVLLGHGPGRLETVRNHYLK